MEITMYKVIKDFKGSPDGIEVIEYKEGDKVDLVPDLADVAIKEKWVKPIAEKVTAPKVTTDPLADEIAALESAIELASTVDEADELKSQLDAKRAELAPK